MIQCSECLHNINATHMAEPSIQAGAWAAVINVDITVCPCPPHSTVTLVPIHHILEQICTHDTQDIYTDELKVHHKNTVDGPVNHV